MNRIDGHILTGEGFVAGSLELGPDGRIARITGTSTEAARIRDAGAPIVLPGFIDLHVHGGGGHDVMEGGDAARHVAASHAVHGTTSLLATTMTAPPAELVAALTALGPQTRKRAPRAARILGVHLEGPFINSGKLGAQPDFARSLGIDEVRSLHAIAPIRLITLAPEMPGHLEAIAELRAAGIVVQIGHSLASYEEARAALDRGASGFTHLFNAMSPFHHRDPGAVGAALLDPRVWCGLIVDGHHVHPAALRVALAARPAERFMLVTDAMSCVGTAAGSFVLQGTRIHVRGGRVVDDAGTLAGSALDMASAVRNSVHLLGLPLEQAARMASTYPAQFMGLGAELGRIAPGYRASLVLVDERLEARRTWIDGRGA